MPLWMSTLFLILGFVMVHVGLALVCYPAALVVSGVLLIVAAVMAE